ncbi:MAG: arsenate reductase family protein [Alkalispirochaetaceae bacterium]
MIPQLIGTKKSAETRKVERYLKERGIAYQFVDLNERSLAPRELDEVAAAVGGHDALIDTESKAFKQRKMGYMVYDSREELLEEPRLLKTPILRCDAGVAVLPEAERLEELLG